AAKHRCPEVDPARSVAWRYLPVAEESVAARGDGNQADGGMDATDRSQTQHGALPETDSMVPRSGDAGRAPAAAILPVNMPGPGTACSGPLCGHFPKKRPRHCRGPGAATCSLARLRTSARNVRRTSAAGW